MSTLAECSPSVKVSGPPLCYRCRGRGTETFEGELRTCGYCDGFGRVREVEQAEDTAFYQAIQADGLIDTGKGLHAFVGQFQRDWAVLQDEHIAIWRLDDGRGPRLVAYLYPDRNGRTAVRWL